MSGAPALCVGGPYAGQTVHGVSQWSAWIPRREPSTRPPRNLSPTVLLEHSHYVASGRTDDGKIIYTWKEVTPDASS